MKQITLSIPDVNFSFFMELINTIDFVKIESTDGDSKQEIIKNLKQGAKELKTIQKGKEIKTASLKEFLNEL